VTSSPSNAKASGWSFFLQAPDVQAENIPRSSDVAIVNRTAIVASPLPYFEALRPFRAADAFATGLSAEVLGVSTNVAAREIAL
jgi:hypothetical protein